jgi:hypothetical protein
MTVQADACRVCGSHSVSVHPVRHHFICAYIGPSYDFKPDNEGDICPKCKRCLTPTGADWETRTVAPSCAMPYATTPSIGESIFPPLKSRTDNARRASSFSLFSA